MEKDFIITGIDRIVYIGKEEYPEKVTRFEMSEVRNELIFNFSGQNTIYFNGKALKTVPDTVRFLPAGRVYEYVSTGRKTAPVSISFLPQTEAFLRRPLLPRPS